MFFRAKDIQLSSYFKVNLSVEKRVHILKNVLYSSPIFTVNQAQFGRGEVEEDTWLKMELCMNLLNSNFNWLQ